MHVSSADAVKLTFKPFEHPRHEVQVIVCFL